MIASTEDAALRVISTGFPSLDYALGIGGYPRGRLIDVYGSEDAPHLAALRHKHTDPCGYGDAVCIDAGSGDVGAVLDQIDRKVRTGAALIVVCRAEYIARLGDDVREDAVRDRAIGRGIRTITANAYKHGTAVVFFRTLDRLSRGAGGNALKFYASIRLDVRSNGVVRVVKNKFAPPFRDASIVPPRVPCPVCVDASCVLCDDDGMVET